MTIVDTLELKVTAKRTVILNSVKHSRKYVSVCLVRLLELNQIQMVGSVVFLLRIRNSYALGKWGG